MAGRKMISALPAPWIDITKTTLFMKFPSPGGPFYDSALHNQAAMVKLLQAVRKELSQEMPFDEIKQKHRYAYADTVKEIMAKPEWVKHLVDSAEIWQTDDGHNMVLSHSAQLQTMADSLFDAFRSTFDDDWWESPDVIIEDIERQLVTLLKSMENNGAHKKDLHLAVAHWMKDNGRQLREIGNLVSTQLSGGPPASTTTGHVVDPGQPARATSRGSARTRRSLGGDGGADVSSNSDPDDGQVTPKQHGHNATAARLDLLTAGGDEDDDKSDNKSDITILHHPFVQPARIFDPQSVAASGDAVHEEFESDVD